LLPSEKDIVNLGYASVDNVLLRVTISSITLSIICYLYIVYKLLPLNLFYLLRNAIFAPSFFKAHIQAILMFKCEIHS